MTDQIREMIDLAFEVAGEVLPKNYPFALWTALMHRFPRLAEDHQVGVLPLRLSECPEGMLLPRRARLMVRVPLELADEAIALLQEQRLEADGVSLNLGAGKKRQLQPSTTVHAHMVAGADDEVQFMGAVAKQLETLDVGGKLICGRRHTLNDAHHSIHGFSLVIHDLKPEASLRLQYAGLGDGRRYGCGIFLPYKEISGLD